MILFANTTDKWMCGSCKWLRDDKPEDWSTCPNCDGRVWLDPYSSPWSTTPPTEPGWYWAMTKNGVYCFNIAESVTGLYCESVGESLDYIVKDYGITHWQGPRTMPEPPERGE